MSDVESARFSYSLNHFSVDFKNKNKTGFSVQKKVFDLETNL